MGSLRFQAGAPLVSEPMLPYAQTASTEISLCLRPRWRHSPRAGDGSDQEAPHRPQGNATLPQGRAVPSEGGWDPGVNVSKKTAWLNPTQSHYDSFEYFLDNLAIFWIGEVVLRSARFVTVRTFATAGRLFRLGQSDYGA